MSEEENFYKKGKKTLFEKSYTSLGMNTLKQEMFGRGPTQRHHITPQHEFRSLGIPVDNSRANIIPLPRKDHAKIYPFENKASPTEIEKSRERLRRKNLW